MLHDAGLAVSRLVALAIVTSIVPVVVLGLVHATTIDTIHVHLLHTIRKHIHIVGTVLVGSTLGVVLRNSTLRNALWNTVAVHGVEPAVVEVVAHGRSASWSVVAHGCWGRSCGARSKGSCTGLQSRLDGGIRGLLAANSSVV